MNDYTIFHLHSGLSNCVTNIDSVTGFQEYVDAAKKCGMKAIAFSEHGSVFEWFHKKKAIEDAGMKYIHAAEVYLTTTLDEKIRDNFHCVLIARNADGFRELNKLISHSFNRKDNHFYYTPRISFDELFATSDNIIITTACIGGVLYKGDDQTKQKFLDFVARNKHRCFLEVGHHRDVRQVQYNKYLKSLSDEHGIPLIAGTDTHVLNSEHERGRKILQLAKNIKFDEEDGWDLVFRNYDELVEAYRLQAALPKNSYLQAIENTNVMADMVEEIKLDMGIKYPKLYEKPKETFRKKIEEAKNKHPYVNKRYAPDVINKVITEELAVYEATQSIDFMLLQTYLREWEAEHGIQCGYGRGSVSGSMIAYILGITKMDSIRFNLNFFRFLNPSRVTNADIDTDYAGADRDKVKEFILKDRLNLPQIRSSEIITFNTIALKGAIRDVGRALEIPLSEVSAICEKCVREGTVDIAPPELRAKYKELFDYVDIVNGTIVSVGTHPSGCLISDLPIDETIGLCSTAASDYPVSMLNMKELDDLMYVKLDILGLDNIGVINETCRALGIERLDPDNVDLEDEAVWKSIRDDTTLIFQWESGNGQAFMKKFMSDATLEIARKKIESFSHIKWLSFGNGLIRPACASFRESVANGDFYDNGFDELNKFLMPEAGRVAMQETIMAFLVKFCGYSNVESDNVRRAIAKKKGTETLLPEIEKRFVEYSSHHYDITREKCEEVIKPFIQVILDASDYAFSWNHSDAYSLTGYVCGYLRYYYPLEFLTSALNIFKDDSDKTAAITKYAKKNGIKITTPKFGFSKSDYFFSKEKQVIAKGLSAVKFMSESSANDLYELSVKKKYNSFIELLTDIDKETSVDSRQIDILIKIDFFSSFGNQRELFRIRDIHEFFKKGQAKQIKKDLVADSPFADVIKKYATDKTKNGAEAKSYTLTDVFKIMQECEQLIFESNMPDLSPTLKVQNFSDIMGYTGYISGKDADRRNLFIREVYPLRRKKDGKQFGYSVCTQSIGSGVESRFTVFNRVYDNDPIKKGDVIQCQRYERNGEYFTLLQYSHIYA